MSRATLEKAIRVFIGETYARRPASYRIEIEGGGVVEGVISYAPAVECEPRKLAPCRHSADFRSCVWWDRDYTFTGTQAAIVAILWAAFDEGVPEVGNAHLLHAAGSDSARVSDLFRRSKAWGVMIVEAGPGLYALSKRPD